MSAVGSASNVIPRAITAQAGERLSGPVAGKTSKVDGAIDAPLTGAKLTGPKLSGVDGKVLEAIRAGDRPVDKDLADIVAMAKGGKLTPEQALLEIDPVRLSHMCVAQFDGADAAAEATGTAISSGCASGVACFDVEEARSKALAGEQVILLVHQLFPKDVDKVKDIVKAGGGLVFAYGEEGSHSAIVARDLGLPATANSREFQIGGGAAILGNLSVSAGDELSINGGTGEVFSGRRTVVNKADDPNLRLVLQWAKNSKDVDVMANADTVESITRALDLGANGVGLVRTEHMFMGERHATMQAAILLDDDEALEKMGQWQKEDFAAIYRTAGDRPVSIRLLDPPRHEITPELPEPYGQLRPLADFANDFSSEGITEDLVRDRYKTIFGPFDTVPEALMIGVQQMPDELLDLAEAYGFDRTHEDVISFLPMLLAARERNPMLGVRGARLGIEQPELYDMQIRSILEAAAEVAGEGITVQPRITIPMVNEPAELQHFKYRIETIKAEVEQKTGVTLDVALGAMLETPASIYYADQMAEIADYFSVGSNDLTQMMLGISRDDTTELMNTYVDKGFLAENPAKELHPAVVERIAYAGNFAKAAKDEGRPFSMGLCGNQGAQPASLPRLRAAGVDYASVSATSVPGALVASAQDAIQRAMNTDAELIQGGFSSLLMGKRS